MNPRSKLTGDDLGKLRYLYKIPKFVEIRALEAHERVDWVVPDWVALYEIVFRDGMRLSIPKLVRDVLDHYEITPGQLMPNAWRILMSLECLSMWHVVICEIDEVLYSYYLKEHDTNKGQYHLIVRKDHVPLITCLRSNNHKQKDKYLFVRGELMYRLCGPGDAASHCKATSKCSYV